MSSKTIYRYPSAYRKRRFKKVRVQKKLSGLSPISVCMRKKIIDKDEFYAANFFLSLYRLRYGDMIIRGYNFDQREKEYQTIKSEEWYEERNFTYHELVKELTKARVINVFLNICVYEEFPNFLKYVPFNDPEKYTEYQKLKDALAIICEFLKKNYSLQESLHV